MKDKRPAIFSLAALVLSLATLMIYIKTGRNEFNTSLSMQVIVPLGIMAAVELFSIFKGVQLLEYAAYLCGLYAWLEYLSSQVYYIVNVFVAIDGTTFSASFLATVICGMLSWITALIAAKCLSRQQDQQTVQGGAEA